MSIYRCMACNMEFEAPEQDEYIRHEKYSGCTWGIGKKTSRPTPRAGDKCPYCKNGVEGVDQEGSMLPCPRCDGTGICT